MLTLLSAHLLVSTIFMANWKLCQRVQACPVSAQQHMYASALPTVARELALE